MLYCICYYLLSVKREYKQRAHVPDSFEININSRCNVTIGRLEITIIHRACPRFSKIINVKNSNFYYRPFGELWT